MVRIQSTLKTEGASNAPVKLVLSAIRKEGDQKAKFRFDISGYQTDVIYCAVCLVDSLLSKTNTPTGVFCEALKMAEEHRKKGN